MAFGVALEAGVDVNVIARTTGTARRELRDFLEDVGSRELSWHLSLAARELQRAIDHGIANAVY